ncbi:PEGA domain-containing protein [Entomospira entomophila]|uniref:PEGA domain-containing protein n=1 Tax=Entomospira entomophila TaxID=2719988 RepID=A0A968G923_9SPIO|nr:PEGA domain-containing protein [Entomospira entomophilus]NIZ40060.1 PEGA domain-containing protein [Entomospira entomophilus]WDI35621.1 PEGA domain-containing protein [Entomospira entomophilus]
MARSKETKLTLKDFSDVHVSLQPIAGMKPQLYLKILYATLLAGILFLLLVLPGITRYGSIVHFNSYPERASIYVNGKRIGSTPMQIFLPAGDHEILLTKPFFLEHKETTTIKGRRLFSLFFPRVKEITPAFEIFDIHGLLETSYKEASFAYSASYSDKFPREPFLLHALDDLIASNQLDTHKNDILRWAIDTWALVSDQQSLEDVIQLWNTLQQYEFPIDINIMTGIRFDPLNPQLGDIISYQQEYIESDYPINLSNNYQTLNSSYLNISGLTFDYQPPVSFLMGDSTHNHIQEFPSTVSLNEFYYTKNLVTQAEFNRVISSSTKTSDDLSDIIFNRFDKSIQDQPVSYVSLPVAKLFIEQINRELMRLQMPWRARLPLESEWEFLAQSKSINTAYYEWMEEGYYPLKNLLFAKKSTARTVFQPFLQSVRGFDPLADRLAMQQYHPRGAQDPSWQSPFISFRIVLEPQ